MAIAVRRWPIPYNVALVLAGLGLGWAHAFPAPVLSKELLFSVFLPGLVFEAAFHIEFKEFWRNRLAIVALAVPGVMAATALTALILTPVAGTPHFRGRLQLALRLGLRGAGLRHRSHRRGRDL